MSKQKKDIKKQKKDTKKENKIYCGWNENIPKGQRRGTMKECLDSKQVRFWGINKIDRNLLKTASQPDLDKQIEKVRLQASAIQGKANNIMKKYKRERDDNEKEKLKQEYNKYVAEYNQLNNKMKNLQDKLDTCSKPVTKPKKDVPKKKEEVEPKEEHKKKRPRRKKFRVEEPTLISTREIDMPMAEELAKEIVDELLEELEVINVEEVEDVPQYIAELMEEVLEEVIAEEYNAPIEKLQKIDEVNEMIKEVKKEILYELEDLGYDVVELEEYDSEEEFFDIDEIQSITEGEKSLKEKKTFLFEPEDEEYEEEYLTDYLRESITEAEQPMKETLKYLSREKPTIRDLFGEYEVPQEFEELEKGTSKGLEVVPESQTAINILDLIESPSQINPELINRSKLLQTTQLINDIYESNIEMSRDETYELANRYVMTMYEDFKNAIEVYMVQYPHNDEENILNAYELTKLYISFVNNDTIEELLLDSLFNTVENILMDVANKLANIENVVKIINESAFRDTSYYENNRLYYIDNIIDALLLVKLNKRLQSKYYGAEF